MLSIGEFSNICKVSTKTLRYYAEIGLLLPSEINVETGYRYYSIKQLETMLLINRLKSYQFSLEEIKMLLPTEDMQDEKLCIRLLEKQAEIEKQMMETQTTLQQMKEDINHLKEGKSIMSYLDDIHVQLVEVESICILFIRKKVKEHEFEEQYRTCFTSLFHKVQAENLTMTAPPMVLFHDAEFSPYGLDTEFAIPIKECVTGTRDFLPGLCLKTSLHGSYTNLPSVYAKQREWAEREGYVNTEALFEVYMNDPSQLVNENALLTEVYYPVKKQSIRLEKGKNYE